MINFLIIYFSVSCLISLLINTKKIEEKFSMIDINGKEGYMISGDSLETEPFGEFLEKITVCILPKISEMSSEESENFIDKLFLIIKEETEKCQS